MKILIYVKCKDGKKKRVSLEDWENGVDPLTVYNHRGLPVYLTQPKLRWSGITEISRSDVVGTWNECWNKRSLGDERS